MINISGEYLNLDDFSRIVLEDAPVNITASCLENCESSHNYLKEISLRSTIYGVNTGFGPMAQYYIAPADQLSAQYNLIRSHASGAGQPLGYLECRALMVARLNTLAKGYSGIHTDLLKVLVEFLNKKVHPFIPAHGGVGASGDLVQLAHLGLNLIGEGEIIAGGVKIPAADALAKAGIGPLKIHGREGLGIMNGTSVMTGIGLLNLISSKKILDLSVSASALLNEFMESFNDHFSARINEVKYHEGQRAIAGAMRNWVDGSKKIKERKIEPLSTDVKFTEKVQEYYSLRCVPQILGPVLDTIRNAELVLLNELNSVNDNPVIDKENNSVWHGGNFHGDYVSFEMDKLRIGLTKLSMLAERQVNYMAADYLNEKFPKFLVPGKPGLNFGIQGMQFTATSTVAENQAYSTSMYIHSIPTNADNQDVVSMGTNSALLTSKVVENCFQVLAIQWITLVRAYCLLSDKTGVAVKTETRVKEFLPLVEPTIDDIPLYTHIESLRQLFVSGNYSKPVEI